MSSNGSGRRTGARAARLPAAAAAILALAAGCGEPPPVGGLPPLSVQVVTASSQTLPRTISAVGSLESSDPTVVAAEVAGRVVALDVHEGERVLEGHVLARLDESELRAATRVAEARFRNARDRLERIRSLLDRDVSSEQAFEDASAEFDAAAAALTEVRTRLARARIRAPFEGVVGLRQASLGQYLEPGDPVVEITRTDPLDLVFAVPQRHVTEVAVGQQVLGVVGHCDERFEARVRAVDPRIHPVTRTLRVEARLDDGVGRLAPGMAVQVRVLVGTIEDAVVLPQEAIVRRGTRDLIWILEAEGSARQREVALGQLFADGVHVERGIAPGDRVVAVGHQKLRPGDAPRALPFEATRNPVLEVGWFGPVEGCGL